MTDQKKKPGQDKRNEKYLQQIVFEAFTQYGKMEMKEKNIQPSPFDSIFNGTIDNSARQHKRNMLNANRTRCHLFAHRFTYATQYCQLHR